MTATPPVRRRLLGSALRRYREGLGYNLDEAARILECDRSKISRIETGQRGIRAKELRELLTEYGVPAVEQEALLAIAHRGRDTGWWLDYRDVLSAAGQDYVIMEIAASEILAYEPSQVPDLLQTVEYASAVADADASYSTAEQRAHAVEVKLNRQAVVLGDRAPAVEFVVGEGALRQAVGGQAVMRAQLLDLARLAETGTARTADMGAGQARGVPGGAGNAADVTRPRARVSLQVLPFTAGAHAAAGSGSMTVLRFAQPPGMGVAHLGAPSGGVSMDSPEDVARYVRMFTRLRAAALTPSASARLLRVIAKA